MTRNMLRVVVTGLLSFGLAATTVNVAGASGTTRARSTSVGTYRSELASINHTFQTAIETATTNYRDALDVARSNVVASANHARIAADTAAEGAFQTAWSAATTPAQKYAARQALAMALASALEAYRNALQTTNNAAAESAALTTFNTAVAAAVAAREAAIAALGPPPLSQ